MPKRIFWLGMHKVLTKTELPRLRTLGYEVFNPPYLSSVKDQSACLEWHADQPTTLAKNVFQALSRFNFFYNEIPADIARLLNDYFDAVVVTISPRWLRSILGAYKGTVIYRTYGQHYVLSDELKREGLLLEIANRNNFIFMPHAEEALYGEHSWLKDIAVVSPYCLPSDILPHEGSWGKCDRRANEIIITCPNIDNPFFREHYQFLKKNFSEKHFLYYGVQISDVDDPQVVGTLAREELIARFKRAAGYLYTYTDPRVCYLPPIEMMVLGGPVLFLRGSLLDRYFGEDAPGRCLDIQDAKEKTERLLVGDKRFIHAIISSQDSVKRRYLPDFVWPHFDKVIVNSLESNKEPSHWLTVDTASKVAGRKRIYLLHHFPGAPVIFDGESYAAYDGIPRVMRQIVQTLNKNCDHEIIITARYDQAEMFRGFFCQSGTNKDNIRVLLIDPPNMSGIGLDGPRMLLTVKVLIKKVVKKVVPFRFWEPLVECKRRIYGFQQRLRKFLGGEDGLSEGAREYQYIGKINNDGNCHWVIVPHYYWFPEALQLNKRFALYLPDYMPHFFHATGEFVADEGYNTELGKNIAAQANVVFCNSHFTKNYLPNSRLKVDSDKIKVFYLPLLNSQTKGCSVEKELPNGLEENKYIFYPTQPRANKNLSLLLLVFDRLINRGHDLKLVLTCHLIPDPKAFAVYNSLKCKERIVILNQVSDHLLQVLYQKAALLCFTSVAEGNFPPQIHEALAYRVPIVAPNLGFIKERIPEHLAGSLLLCQANNQESFVNACETVLASDRDAILEQQDKLLEAISQEGEQDFLNKVVGMFR